MIGGTKGSHLVIKNDLLREAVGVSEFFFENKDGRIVLLLPFFDRVIVGTSDLPIEHPDDARCTKEEEEYFLDLVKRVFPTVPVTRDQIVFRFSGVRPLEYMKAKTTGQITRDHSMKFNDSRWNTCYQPSWWKMDEFPCIFRTSNRRSTKEAQQPTKIVYRVPRTSRWKRFPCYTKRKNNLCSIVSGKDRVTNGIYFCIT